MAERLCPVTGFDCITCDGRACWLVQRTDRYDPPEKKIAEVIKKTGGDPRKLAIAYLRAQHRAREADAMSKLTGDLFDASIALSRGDGEGVIDALKRGQRHVASHNDVEESQ